MTLLLLLLSFLPLGGDRGQVTHRLTNAEVRAVVEAVQDEIYDTGNQTAFYQIGDNLGTPQHWKSRMRIYINPDYDDKEKVGQAIYKFMPYGEILRVFYLKDDGTVQLDGDSHNRFPPTQPSLQTVYMDDAEVCRMKQSWRMRFFVVDTSPNEEVIAAAARRQRLRTGFSEWEHQHGEKGQKVK